MSLFGALYSGVSGLNAQSRSMGSISENIANVNTVGYKSSDTSFSTLVAGSAASSFRAPSGVEAETRNLIEQQGLVQLTSSATDIAITGDGFFPVSTSAKGGVADGDFLFTRAGSFRTDSNNNLRNVGGQYMLGWPLNPAGEVVNRNGNVITPDPTSTNDLQAVTLNGLSAKPQPTTEISINAALPVAKVGEQMSTSLQIFDDLGVTHQVSLDFIKVDNLRLSAGTLDTSDSPVVDTVSVTDSMNTAHDLTFTYTATSPNNWTLDVTSPGPNDTVTGGTIPLTFDGSGNLTSGAVDEFSVDWDSATANDSTFRLTLDGLTETTGGGSSATHAFNPTDADLRDWKVAVSTGDPNDTIAAGATTYVSFNSNGTLDGPENVDLNFNWDDADTFAANSAVTLNLGIEGTSSGLSNRGTAFLVSSLNQNGLESGDFTSVSVDDRGRVIANFDNGSSLAVYQIPIATFNNPNGLTPVSGNGFQRSVDSGDFLLNRPDEGGAGSVASQSLEASTVDIAGEFSKMIITQRAFSANATIITTSDQMLEELSRIKR